MKLCSTEQFTLIGILEMIRLVIKLSAKLKKVKAICLRELSFTPPELCASLSLDPLPLSSMGNLKIFCIYSSS